MGNTVTTLQDSTSRTPIQDLYRPIQFIPIVKAECPVDHKQLPSTGKIWMYFLISLMIN